MAQVRLPKAPACIRKSLCHIGYASRAKWIIKFNGLFLLALVYVS